MSANPEFSSSSSPKQARRPTPLANPAESAENHGMKVGLFPGAALLLALGALSAGRVAGVEIPWLVVAACGIGAVVAFTVGLHRKKARRPGQRRTLDTSLFTAMPEWRAGRRSALEGMVAEFVGPTATAHALRCSALAEMLAEQLALLPEESGEVALAALVHVLPSAFPEDEDGEASNCAFGLSAIAAATGILERSAPAGIARIASEANEKWDGTGRPNRLTGEAITMGGRILAAACAFDHASMADLESGLELVRRESGSAFDPVVAAELIHLFREPWQRRVAA
jgi:hypothetical protein